MTKRRSGESEMVCSETPIFLFVVGVFIMAVVYAEPVKMTVITDAAETEFASVAYTVFGQDSGTEDADENYLRCHAKYHEDDIESELAFACGPGSERPWRVKHVRGLPHMVPEFSAVRGQVWSEERAGCVWHYVCYR